VDAVSGEAGALIDGTHYRIFIGSGVRVSYEPPPGDDGSAIGRYFEEDSAPYQAWLARARPELDALFAAVVAEGAPIVPLAQTFEEIDGTIIEPDRDLDRHFKQYHQGGPLAVRLDGGRHMPDYQSMNLHFLVSRRVQRSELDPIVERVIAALLRTR
jgi:hypothetical protein